MHICGGGKYKTYGTADAERDAQRAFLSAGSAFFQKGAAYVEIYRKAFVVDDSRAAGNCSCYLYYHVFLSGRSGGVNFRKRCDTGGAGGQKSRDGFG